MEITAAMVKELRDITGAGMMDCKKALAETGGDIEAAIDTLRTKGLADLAKRAGRATNEGVIVGAVSSDGRVGALVEVNCETDFVARNAAFKEFVSEVAAHVAETGPATVEELLAAAYRARPEITVKQLLGEAVGKLGENMSITRFTRYELTTGSGTIAVYIHGVGNIGVMVEAAAGSADAASSGEVVAFAKDVAMQIAAASPIAVRREEIGADVIAHELEIYKAQAAETGKPEQIQDKIAQGRLEKYYKEVCLFEQAFVKDPDIPVKEYAERTAKAIGASVDVVRFERMVLGETNPDGATSACG